MCSFFCLLDTLDLLFSFEHFAEFLADKINIFFTGDEC
jgi:hypothetical protein